MDYVLVLTTYPAYLGGGHTYARLYTPGGDVDVYLTRVLDEAGVRDLARTDPDAGYVSGDETERFTTPDDATAAATDWMSKHARDGDRLFSRASWLRDGLPIQVITATDPQARPRSHRPPSDEDGDRDGTDGRENGQERPGRA
jgi:hypothetical protein